ncbi:hypothetical protein PHLCEN_2v2656 [Hermanssonia centrifuga]|uniref:Uncharacterized protein n=1 Tax=Hermanssonia centrifuga TaxID=98765 RepID=A0A2R6RIL6_9APHY|nr:hypothetical protein PHLCEN_2v2656 [Hermanssonia centrifuga]
MEIAQVLVETMVNMRTYSVFKMFPAMLMSRFLFNLREIGAQTEYSADASHNSSSLSRLPTLIIFRVVGAVGNIGEALDHCGFDQGTDDEGNNTETDSLQMDDTLPAKYGYTHNSGIPAQIERRGKWRGRRDD